MRYQKPGFLRSLNQAWRGMLYTVKTQGHMQFHVLAGSMVMGIAWWTEVSRFEWLTLVLAIGCVIGAEVMNSAVEIVVDMVQPNFHPLAGMAKDVASGAVLVSVIQAIVIGLIVFAPLVYRLVGKVF